MNFAVERVSSIPLWRQIYHHLLYEIRSGEFASVSKLPSAGQMAAQFGVNRHTVRRAIRNLEDEGIVESIRGAGTFISRQIIDYPISKRTRFSTNVIAQGMKPSSQLVQVKRIKPNENVANALGIPQSGEAILVERLLFANDLVIGIGLHFFSAQRLSGLDRTIPDYSKISQVLTLHGIDNYYRQSTIVAARMPSKREARLLRHPRPSPVLETRSINVDSREQPIEFGITVFNSSCVQIRFVD